MTFAELCERVSDEEFREWQAYYKIRADDVREQFSESRARGLAEKNFHR